MKFPCLTTSWDDGHPLDFRLADMLDKHGLTGTFYIPRTCDHPTMSDAQVRELSTRFEIGAHTMTHPFLDTVSDDVARAEITDSKKWIEETTGKPCKLFCPPGGKFDTKRLSQIAAAGYSAIRTVEMISVAKPVQHDDLMLIPTSLQAHPHSPAVYLRNILKRRCRNLWLYITRGRSRDWPTLADSLMQAAVARSGVFHLWGHSWELEASGQWERLEEVLKVMGQIRKSVPRVTNWQVVEATKC